MHSPASALVPATRGRSIAWQSSQAPAKSASKIRGINPSNPGPLIRVQAHSRASGFSLAEQTYILHADDIEGWQEPQEAANNVVVEVFVPPRSKACSALPLAFQEAFAKTGTIGSRFVELANSIVLQLTLL